MVYGECIPDGECWFVGRRDMKKNFIELWNPKTGECYNYDKEVQTTKSIFGSTTS